MTSTTPPDLLFGKNDRVAIAVPEFAGQIWTVAAVNPRSYTLVPEGRSKPRQTADHDLVTDPVTAAIAHPHLVPGTLVRFQGTREDGGIGHGDLAVVMKDYGTGKVKSARLGGAEGYTRHLPRHLLDVIDPATVIR